MADYKDYGFTTGAPSHTFGYLLPPLLRMLDKTENKLILDLGCGNGFLANYLLNQGFEAYGTDASEQGIAIAKQKNPERFFLQDLSTGKLPPELRHIKFDTLLSTEVIEHLYNPAAFIDFCKGILTKGGELVISTPYHGYWKNLLLAILGKWDVHHDATWHGGHIKFWSKKTLTKLLTDKGFTVTEFKGCGRIPYLWKSMIIKAKLL